MLHWKVRCDWMNSPGLIILHMHYLGIKSSYMTNYVIRVFQMILWILQILTMYHTSLTKFLGHSFSAHFLDELYHPLITRFGWQWTNIAFEPFLMILQLHSSLILGSTFHAQYNSLPHLCQYQGTAIFSFANHQFHCLLSTKRRKVPSSGIFEWKCFRDCGTFLMFQHGPGISQQIHWAFERAAEGSSHPSELDSGSKSDPSSHSFAFQTSAGQNLCPSQRVCEGHRRYPGQSSCHSTCPTPGPLSHGRMAPWPQATMPNDKDKPSMSLDA